jgi:two-component system response regulator CpxR
MKPKKTILCADGNEQSLSIRKVMLETRGYRVLAYSNCELALNRLKSGGVDLLLADVTVPGFEANRLVEQAKGFSPEIPAILLSAKVRSYDHETKADLYLSKNMYGPAELLDRIRLLLVRKRGPKPLSSSAPIKGVSAAA